MSSEKTGLTQHTKVKKNAFMSKTEERAEIIPAASLEYLLVDKAIRRLLDPYWAGRIQLRPF